MIKVYDLICDKDIIKRNSIRAKKEKVISRMEACFEDYYSSLDQAMELTNCCIVEENQRSLNQPELDSSKYLMTCYISLGIPLQEIIDQHIIEGKIFEGYFLNEIANEMIMNLSTKMFKKLKIDMNLNGFNMTKRYSPGECMMEMSYQKNLKEILEEKAEIDIHLTENMLIVPSKSMMYCYGADEHNAINNEDISCTNCSKENCCYSRKKA